MDDFEKKVAERTARYTKRMSRLLCINMSLNAALRYHPNNRPLITKWQEILLREYGIVNGKEIDNGREDR